MTVAVLCCLVQNYMGMFTKDEYAKTVHKIDDGVLESGADRDQSRTSPNFIYV